MKKFASSLLLCFICINFLHSQVATLTQQPVASDVTKNSSIFAADIDGDGYKDIIGNSDAGNSIFWWKNDGGDQTNWTRYPVDENFERPLYLFSEDMDNDGRMDIIATGWQEASRVAWWHNDGGDPIEWTREIIREDFGDAQGVFVKDINGDNRLDILATSTEDSLLCWWENTGTYPDIDWVEHTIDSTANHSQCIISADIDNDEDNDVIATWHNKVMLYINDGQDPVHWTRQTVDNYANFAHWLDTGDFNNDGHMDIVAANYMENSLKWFENSGEETISWTQRDIGGYFPKGLTIYTADINNDGYTDIAGTSYYGSGLWCDISWWENNGGEAISFTKYKISDDFTLPWGMYVADIDNDDDIDLIVGSNHLDQIIWFENGLYTNGITDSEENLFAKFSLDQNYPNPFNPSTTINFSLAKPGNVKIQIFNINGQLIKTLLNENKAVGEHIVKWNGTNSSEEKVSSGVYFYELNSNGFSETKRMVLLK